VALEALVGWRSGRRRPGAAPIPSAAHVAIHGDESAIDAARRASGYLLMIVGGFVMLIDGIAAWIALSDTAPLPIAVALSIFAVAGWIASLGYRRVAGDGSQYCTRHMSEVAIRRADEAMPSSPDAPALVFEEPRLGTDFGIRGRRGPAEPSVRYY
jgi:hypothetical protein